METVVSENMELKLSIRETQTDLSILIDKLSSLNENVNVLTASLSEKCLEKPNSFS